MSSSTGNITADGLSSETRHDRTAFVYGTLMVPQILYRVCHLVERPHPDLISHLSFRPALLRDYSRRKVRYADFPAITAQKSHTVLGTLISGLSDEDVVRLDGFEGAMYERVVIEVEALDSEVFDQNGNINEVEMERVKATKEIERKMVKAETYVWCLDDDWLRDEEWSFADFRRDRMREWVRGPQLDNGGQDKVEGSGAKTEKEHNADEETDKGHVEMEIRRVATVLASVDVEGAEEIDNLEALKSAV